MTLATLLADPILTAPTVVPAPANGQSLGQNEAVVASSTLSVFGKGLVLFVGGASAGARVVEIAALAAKNPGTVLLAACGEEMVIPAPVAEGVALRAAGTAVVADVKQLLARHELRAGMIVFDRDVAIDAVVEWLEQTPALLAEGGLVLGGHALGGPVVAKVFAALWAQGLNPQPGSDFWLAAATRTKVPVPVINIQGLVRPIHYGQMVKAYGAAPSKESFLRCVEDGIPARYVLSEGADFHNQLPENVRNASDDVKAQFVFTPPYREFGRTEGGFLAHMRNVRVSGLKGYVYSDNGDLFEESFGVCAEHIHGLKTIGGSFEATVFKAEAAHGQFRWQSLAAVFPPEVRIEEPVVLASYNDLHIFNHWIFGVLPRFWYLDEFPEMAKLPIVMGPVQSRYQVEYLDILGLLDNARFIFRNPSVALSLNQAFYATLVDRPHSSKAVIDWMRGRFIKHAAKIPAGLENGLYYISRGDAGWRKISNEAEIIDFLKGYGFNVIRWTDYSVREQIALANHAKVLIGAHGSNMSNMVYTNPECRVLDIHNQAAGMAGSDWISFMVPTIGGRYYAVVGQNDNPLAPPSIADFAVNLEQFRSVFSQMMDGLN